MIAIPQSIDIATVMRASIVDSLPDAFWIVLFADDGKEANYQGYRRVRVPRDYDHFKVMNRKVRNKRSITFPKCQADYDKKLIGFGCCTSEVGGELLFEGRFSKKVKVVKETAITFQRGDMQITLDKSKVRIHENRS